MYYFLPAPGAQATDSNGGFNMMFFMVAWLVAAVVLFMLRPQSTRQGGNEKPPSNQVQGLHSQFVHKYHIYIQMLYTNDASLYCVTIKYSKD